MPTQVNSSYSASFQKFVDFSEREYATKGIKGEGTVARFSGMPRGDYKGTFASISKFSLGSLRQAGNPYQAKRHDD